MYRSHLVRMAIQVIFMCISIGMQYELFKSPLGFFNRSVLLFGFNLVLNLMILVWIKCYMVVFERKLNYNLSSKHWSFIHIFIELLYWWLYLYKFVVHLFLFKSLFSTFVMQFFSPSLKQMISVYTIVEFCVLWRLISYELC